MAEYKDISDSLITELMAMDYAEEAATKCFNDYLMASRTLRQKYLRKYLGKRVRAKFDGLMFDVIVKEVSLDKNGEIQYQVSPINGSGSVWIKQFSL